MTGEYNIKVNPWPEEDNWRNAKMASVTLTLEIDREQHTFEGMLGKKIKGIKYVK